MDIAKLVELLISLAGLALGATYVVGGLIVNLHLSHYGVTQYQVLRVKYLVVGLTYFTNFIAILFLAAIPAVFVAASSPLVQQGFLVVSLLASVALLWLWAKPARPRAFIFSWRFWVLVAALSSIAPLTVGLKAGLTLGLGGQINFESALLSGLAFLAGVLSFVGQIYYYARHLYGKPNAIFGSVDPIGMGIPVHVQLAGEKEKLALLGQIGVPLAKPEATDKVLLLDETDTHYIIGVSGETGVRAVEVAKEIVKAIRYT